MIVTSRMVHFGNGNVTPKKSKYKRRKVYARRDYPENCGQSTLRIKQQLIAHDAVVSENGSSPDECLQISSCIVEEMQKPKIAGVVYGIRTFPKGCGQNAPPVNVNLIPDTASIVEVFDPLEPQESLTTLVPLVAGTLKSSNMMELTNSIKQAEFHTGGPLKNFNQSELYELKKNLDDPDSYGLLESDSQLEEKGLPSRLVQLPVDSVCSETRVQLVVSDQPKASDAVEAVESNMHKKYPPRRRISACRDFPPLCTMNSPCCITEVNSFRDASVGNEKASEQNIAELIVRDYAKEKERIEDEDTLRCRLDGNITRETGDKDQVMLLGEVESLNIGHVHDSAILESKLELEDMDDTHIQSRRDNIISRSDLEFPSSCKKVDTESERSGQKLSMEFIKHGKAKSLKRKCPGESVDDIYIVNQSQMQEYVGLELSNRRVIVQALMAAPNCPWNLGKLNLKSPNSLMHATTKRIGKNHVESCTINQSQMQEYGGVELLNKRVVVQALMAAPNCPWSLEKSVSKSPKVRSRLTAERRGDRKKKSSTRNDSESARQLVLTGEVDYTRHMEDDSPLVQTSHNMDLSLVPFGVDPFVDENNANEGVTCNEISKALPLVQTSYNTGLSFIPFVLNPLVDTDTDNKGGVTRTIVRETLRLFQGIVRKLLQDAESKSKGAQAKHSRRADLVCGKILKEQNRWVNTGKPILGIVPGVEVGDEFHYRVELAVIGLHRAFQNGIDSLKRRGKSVATSIVASGGYNDVMNSSDVLVYSGQGGVPVGENKKAEDQKLERGNLSLKNSIDEETPVRVIRGFKEPKGNNSKMVSTYIYDGLYLVEKFWQEQGRHGTLVYKFQLRRIPGQPELAIKEVKKSKKSRLREGLCVEDISQGKEKRAIAAINIVDDEKPPLFEYITSMIYPSLYNLTPPQGCECTDGCSDSENCLCATRNGGEIPFNYDGAIVEAKPLIYECGPSCKCPPSCHNRVSQHGIKFQLEIFKTESRGWGVRSLTSIPSGSFICEYTGELLRDEEADQRTYDEYLFDIGHNYNDQALWEGLSNLPVSSKPSSSCEPVEEEGFTIDAAQYGSVGRFINHSCSPNLYAQNVLYDHDDKSMPHIMLFAAENIPPLQELTYHYNYELDQVRDSSGNIKQKNCYCGSLECTGRMY